MRRVAAHQSVGLNLAIQPLVIARSLSLKVKMRDELYKVRLSTFVIKCQPDRIVTESVEV